MQLNVKKGTVEHQIIFHIINFNEIFINKNKSNNIVIKICKIVKLFEWFAGSEDNTQFCMLRLIVEVED